jgi:predicted transcriptional regulator of viral defense system
MAKIMNWQNAQKKIKEKGLWIFGPRDLARLFRASRSAVSFFVHRNTKKGLLVRLKKSKRGSLYALADSVPDQYIIANRLYEPSYISLDSALSFYGIIPETIYGVTSVTPNTTRQFEVEKILYSYFRVKKQVYTGYRPISYKGATVLMAEPEKALADYLYYVDLKKRGLHYERLDLSKIKKGKLLKQVKLFNRAGMLELVEKIYAEFRKPQRIY